MNEAEMDDQAWKEIVCHLDKGEIGEAKTAFLTRCSESAIEGIRDFEKEDEKQRTALEELEKGARNMERAGCLTTLAHGKNVGCSGCIVCSQIRPAIKKLDALNEGKS